MIMKFGEKPTGNQLLETSADIRTILNYILEKLVYENEKWTDLILERVHPWPLLSAPLILNVETTKSSKTLVLPYEHTGSQPTSP
jgi:hypothetical protein